MPQFRRPSDRPSAPSAGAAATRGVDAREVRAAREVVNKLQIALKTCRLFPPYHVNVQSTIASLEERLQGFLRDFHRPLVLDTAATDLFYRGTLVYSAPSRDKSFAYRLAASGVARLAFLPGINRRELMQLLDVFHCTEFDTDLEDDFVTLLWEKDCRHIEVAVRDDMVESVLVPQLPSRDQVILRTAGALVSPAARARRAAAVPEQRLVYLLASTALDEVEASMLRARAEQEARAAPLLSLVDLLLDLYEDDGHWATFEDALRLIHATACRLLERRQLAAVRALAEQFAAAEERPRLADARHRAAIDNTWAALGQSPAIDRVVALLDDPNVVLDDDLFIYLEHLRPNAIEPLFGAFLRDRHCDRLAPVLARMGGTPAIGRFAAGLRSANPQVVRQTAALLILIDRERGLRCVLELTGHAEPSLRLCGLQALEDHGEAQQLEQALPLIEDSDREVRRAALKLLAHRPIPEAFGPLWQLYRDRSKLDLDDGEIELALEAAALADPELAATIFPSVLAKRTWLRPRRAALETEQARVVRALARVPNPRVRAALRELATGPAGFVQRLCTAALAAQDPGDGGDRDHDATQQP